MKLESLKRALNRVSETQQFQITDIVTDRHISVKKFMRDERPLINHWFDVWHVAKGMYEYLFSHIRPFDAIVFLSSF